MLNWSHLDFLRENWYNVRGGRALLLLPYTDLFSFSERLLRYFALYLAAQDLASQTMKSYYPLFVTYKFQWACQTLRSVFPTNVEENTGRYQQSEVPQRSSHNKNQTSNRSSHPSQNLGCLTQLREDSVVGSCLQSLCGIFQESFCCHGVQCYQGKEYIFAYL